MTLYPPPFSPREVRHERRHIAPGRTGAVWRTAPAATTNAVEFVDYANMGVVVDVGAQLVPDPEGLDPQTRHTTIRADGRRFARTVLEGVEWGPVVLEFYDEWGPSDLRDTVNGEGWLYLFADVQPALGLGVELVGARYECWHLHTDMPPRIRWATSEGPRKWFVVCSVLSEPAVGTVTAGPPIPPPPAWPPFQWADNPPGAPSPHVRVGWNYDLWS